MTITRAVRGTAVLLLVVGLAACAERSGGVAPPRATSSPSTALPAEADALVLRVEHVGGFTMPGTQAVRLPIASVHADGRVITEGPVPAIYPGPALPNVQVQQIDRDRVRELVVAALAAGVADELDLGRPPIADATSTRFTVVTDEETYVREVYALFGTGDRGLPGAGPDDSLTGEQLAARDRLAGFLDELTSLATPPRGPAEVEQYRPEALAVVVRPWTDPQDELDHREMTWPGPPLPGEPLGGLPDLTCLTVEGDEVGAVLTAADEANAATPWVGDDGHRWSLTFRPLLPDESGCADLVD